MGAVKVLRGCYVLATGVVLALVASITRAAELSAGSPEVSQFNIRIPEEKELAAVRSAVAGAYQRLAAPACRQVVGDFENVEGLRLDQVLATEGQTPQSFLSLLLFYDASRQLLCGDGGRLAFTEPGSRVIFVCARRFRQHRTWDPVLSEAVIIHEMLHSLGLGEDPPSSQEITARVVDRCS